MRVSSSHWNGIVVLQLGIPHAWQEEDRKRSELAQLTSYWLVLGPMATSGCKGGWESGSPTQPYPAALSELELSRQRLRENVSRGALGRLCLSVLLAITWQTCAGTANSCPLGLGEGAQERYIFPVFLVAFPFHWLGWKWFPWITIPFCCQRKVKTIFCWVQYCTDSPRLNNGLTYHFFTSQWCKSIQ